jgi:hypothetical protein
MIGQNTWYSHMETEMSDDINAEYPEGCLEHSRNAMTKLEYDLAVLKIKLYGFRMIQEYAQGGWVDQEAAALKVDTAEGRIAMIIGEGLNMLYSWLDKEPGIVDRSDLIGLMIAREAWKHYNVSLELALGHLISNTDEKTVAMALKTGRAAREKPQEERRNFLRLVYTAPTADMER